MGISWKNPPSSSANYYNKPQCSNGTCEVPIMVNGQYYGFLTGVPQSGMDTFMQAAEGNLSPPAGIRQLPLPQHSVPVDTAPTLPHLKAPPPL